MENSLQDKLKQIYIKKYIIGENKAIENFFDESGNLNYSFENATSNFEWKDYLYKLVGREKNLEFYNVSSQSMSNQENINDQDIINEGLVTKEQILNIIFSAKPDYINQITNMIVKDEFEDGVISESERFVKKIVEEEGIETVKGYLMNIYYENIKNPHVLCGIMNIISNINYSEMVPQGPIMALGLLQNESYEVRDNAIKAFENWNSKEGISCLESLKCDKKWMQDYVEEVIAYLRESGE